MQQSWIVAYIITVIMVIHGHVHDLRVSIVPKNSRVDAKTDVEVTLTYKNQGPNTVLIYKWYVPNGEPFHPLFEVTRDGKRVEYVGAQVKRRAPIAADMIPLKAGKHMSTLVKLSLAYNMTETGKYTIQIKSDVGSMLLTSTRELGIENIPFNNDNEVILQSDPVTLFVEGRLNERISTSPEVYTQAKGTNYGYSGCTRSRQNLISSAVQSAISYSNGVIQYLGTLHSVATTRYITWFGKYSSKNLRTVKKHFNNIRTVYISKRMVFDCSTCNQPNTFAYVYPYRPYKIYLCSDFWQAPVIGTDSKAGTLIHETSHFKVVAGTLDIAYDQSGCKALAIKNPAQAIKNADSHEYMAENNPALK